MKKILFIHDYPPIEGGGLAISTLELAEELKSTYKVTILSSRDIDEFVLTKTDIDNDIIKVIDVEDSNEIMRIINENDIICSNLTFSFRTLGLCSIVYSKILKKKVITIMHSTFNHSDFNYLKSIKRIEKENLLKTFGLILNLSDKIIGVSEEVRESLKRIGIDKEIQIIPEFFKIPNNTINNSIERNGIYFIGEISYIKGADIFCKAAAHFKDTNEKFYMIGEGPLRIDLEKKYPNILFLGRLNHRDVYNYLNKAKLLIIPSRSEAYPRIILEALYFETPMILSDINALRNMISSKIDNYLFKNGDFVSLIARIKEYLENGVYHNMMGKDFILEKFDLNTQLKIWKQCLE